MREQRVCGQIQTSSWAIDEANLKRSPSARGVRWWRPATSLQPETVRISASGEARYGADPAERVHDQADRRSATTRVVATSARPALGSARRVLLPVEAEPGNSNPHRSSHSGR